VAVELAPPRGDSGYGSELALDLRRRAIERGVLLRPLGSVLYAMPPACLEQEECALLAEVMAELIRGAAG
jgi:adenosylmethionine-8-amino-7-oxononanoate aminotransferase